MGLCAETDPELFFPDKGGSNRRAKELCMRCPEFLDCLKSIMTTKVKRDEDYGVIAATDPRQRAIMRRELDPGIFEHLVILDLAEVNLPGEPGESLKQQVQR